MTRIHFRQWNKFFESDVFVGLCCKHGKKYGAGIPNSNRNDTRILNSRRTKECFCFATEALQGVLFLASTYYNRGLYQHVATAVARDGLKAGVQDQSRVIRLDMCYSAQGSMFVSATGVISPGCAGSSDNFVHRLQNLGTKIAFSTLRCG